MKERHMKKGFGLFPTTCSLGMSATVFCDLETRKPRDVRESPDDINATNTRHEERGYHNFLPIIKTHFLPRIARESERLRLFDENAIMIERMSKWMLYKFNSFSFWRIILFLFYHSVFMSNMTGKLLFFIQSLCICSYFHVNNTRRLNVLKIQFGVKFLRKYAKNVRSDGPMVTIWSVQSNGLFI